MKWWLLPLYRGVHHLQDQLQLFYSVYRKLALKTFRPYENIVFKANIIFIWW